MKTLKNLTAITFIVMLSVVLSRATHINPLLIAGVLFVAGIATYVVKAKSKQVTLFEGLAPEVWIPLVKEEFYPDNSFLNGAMDMSAFVNYDKINFAEAGADPNVLKNNTQYPIAVTKATDTPKSIELDYYDTESTWIENATAVEMVYDQKILWINKHKKSLLKKLGLDAAYSYAPSQTDNAKHNNVLNLGSTDSIVDATIDLRAFYDGLDDDGSNRHIVFDPQHMAAISKEDKQLYKAILYEKGMTLNTFKVWTYSRNPFYNGSTGVKTAQGSAFINGTHKRSTFSFIGNEVMKALGTVEMFAKLKDPDYKGDILNFQMRALVGSLRGKFQGAIIK